MYRVLVNQNKTEAVIHFETHSIKVSHDQGQVIELIMFLLTPNMRPNITLNQYWSSLEDTVNIELSQIETRKAA